MSIQKILVIALSDYRGHLFKPVSIKYNIMEAEAKHYKFINSKTGNVIYYYTITQAMTPDQAEKQLNTIKTEVATSNGLYSGTIYWEEIKAGE